jgi:D-amino-acid dehydrogenase
MGPHLRFAGTLELAGYDLSINQRRVQAILWAADDYLTGMEEKEIVEIWRGLRPCSPDGLPYIGRSAAYSNLIIAAGHAMLGLSMGPITGQLVAELAAGERPSLDLAAFNVDRFG